MPAVTTESASRSPRFTTALRGDDERVSPLELFFDLVFVLALTQCTAAMADDPTWEGLTRALLVLALLWWAWGGYAWLTSVVDPEETSVRLAIFVAMTGFLVCALCVPTAFGEDAGIFVAAYATVRLAHLALFFIASGEDPDLRSSVIGLAGSTAVGVALLSAAAFTDGTLQGALWAVALLLDYGGPYFFGTEGWKMVPHHFAERFALIIIIALGESIVAIGVGAHGTVDGGVVAASALGVAVVAALWWLYFDVVALVAARRLENAKPGRERNEIGRDSFGYLHLPMVAGIVLIALGLKKTFGDVEHELKLVPAVALLGGTAMYLLGHAAFRWRNVHRFSAQRVLVSVICVALIALAVEIPALATLGILAAILAVLVTYETFAFRELRERLRRQLAEAHH
jgi:low temperature requirement protein LtrA